MHGFTRVAGLALVLVLLGGGLMPGSASAQVIQVYYPPSAPVVSYYAPPAAVTYSYYPPATYCPPTTVFSAPTTVYSAPVYAAPPTAVYYPPTVTNTGVVTTRSYFGLGIFRPFGYNQTSYYTPTGVVVNPGRVSYYSPVYYP